MFDIFFKKSSSGLEQSLMEILTIDAIKAQISDEALEKAAEMIAKSIAKSEFKVKRKGGLKKDEIYWMLNVKPNENETATEFWMKAIKRLILRGECLIIQQNKKLYLADSFAVDNAVFSAKKYTDVYVMVNDDAAKMNGTFFSGDVLHLRNTNKNLMTILKKNLALYNDILSAMVTSKKISSVPKFTLEVGTGLPVIHQKDENGEVKPLTIDQYKENIKKLLSSENIEIVTNQNGLAVNQLSVNTSVTAEEITKIRNEIYLETAQALDIPKAVFLGEITEKADSTNEFITYSVNWLVEMLNDAMNAALVGKEDFLKGEKIFVDMSKYKHVDIIESANGLDKLRAIGYTLDELFELTGWEPINTEFSKKRALTKNYADEGGETGEKKEDS